MRFDSISVLGAVRPRALTPAPAHHHTQSGLSPFLTQPAHRNAVLTIRAVYCIWLFFGFISSAFTPTPHRVPIRTGYTEFVLSQHKTLFIARAVKRCRFIHIPLEQTYSIPHFRISQTRYKLVTSDLHTHVQKRIQPAICTNVVYSFNMNACTTRLHTSTWVAIRFNIQPNSSIIASDKVH